MGLSQRTSLERPDIFDGDSLFVYHFATKWCKNKKVLDVGTGYGFGAEYLRSKGAKDITGIDFDKNAISQAKAKNKKNSIKFLCMDATKLSFPKQSFDVIVAFEVLEHLPPKSHTQFIKTSCKLLRSNGVLLLSTPNKLVTSPTTDVPTNPYHFKEYTPDQLERLMKKYFPTTTLLGMKIVNKKFNTEFQRLDMSFKYKIFKIFGKSKVLRDIISFFPKSVRAKISGEDKLPKRGIRDYKANQKDIHISRNLITISRK